MRKPLQQSKRSRLGARRGRAEGEYVTKEAAFEAVAGAASNSIKEGHEVRIHIPGSDGEAALGSR
jgi:hypothetical protein